MVHIYTEDTTSGPDFIGTIIRRVFHTVKPYKIHLLDGATNCNVFLRNLSCDNYCTGDILILYFDTSTVNQKYLQDAVKRLQRKEVSVYIQSFYCFESVFYSYNLFHDGVLNFGKYHEMFEDFAKCLEAQYDFNTFKHKYVQILTQVDLTNVTLESAANIVFSICTYNMPCVHVSKKGYTTLDACLQKRLPLKAFYNNCCNTFKAYSVTKPTVTYCTNKQKQNYCSIQSKHRGCTGNLRHFYENTVLSATFFCVQGAQLVRTNKTLMSLLCEE